MSRWFVTLITLAGLLGSTSAARAQDSPQPGQFELYLNPVGGMFWTEGSENGGGPDFDQYNVAVAGTWNFHPRLAVEGELAGDIGVEQRLTFPGPRGRSIADITPPNLLAYSGNIVYYPYKRSLAPYVTGGVGGLTLFERAGLVDDDETFFAANVGGGVKYFFGPWWGIRADYRFFWVNGKDDGPAFFGRDDDRYGHRVSGGVVLNLVR